MTTRQHSLASRLTDLERKVGLRSATLYFPDGSSCGVHIQQPLDLLLAAWRMTYFYKFTRNESEPPQTEPPSLEVSAKHRQLIRLFGRAERVETEPFDRFFLLILGACREALGLFTKSEKEEKNANHPSGESERGENDSENAEGR